MQLFSSLKKSLLVRVFGLSVLCAMPLSGCVPGEHPRHGDDGEDDGPPYDDPCLNDIMFKVEGDLFTPMSFGAQTLDSRGSAVTESPFGWNPEIEPRAKSHMTIDGYEGKAELLWNDEVVGTFVIDAPFALSDRTGVIEYVDADGTRVEYHIFARPLCASYPSGPLTRAQLAALEK